MIILISFTQAGGSTSQWEKRHTVNSSDAMDSTNDAVNNVSKDKTKVDSSEQKQNRDQISSPPQENLAWSRRQLILLIVISALVAIAATYLWCYVTGCKGCPTKNYTFQRFKYYYYYYVKSWFTRNKYV